MKLIEEFIAFELYRGLNLLKGFTSSMTQKTTPQLMNIIPLTVERRISRKWQVMSVSLTRLTNTPPFTERATQMSL